MKASELIKLLQAEIDKGNDLQVCAQFQWENHNHDSINKIELKNGMFYYTNGIMDEGKFIELLSE